MSIPVSTLTGSNTINQMMYNVNTIKDLAANSAGFVANTVFQSALANTNSYIATKVNTSTFNSALANTNAYIATVSATERAALANTNAYIASVASSSITGPGSSTDNAVVRFDGTSGSTGQNSGVTIADDNSMIISGSSSGDMLRITQTGAGNALLVEDSTNPDSTPFVVNASGNVGIGTTSPGVELDIVGNKASSVANRVYNQSTSAGSQSMLSLQTGSANHLVNIVMNDNTGSGYFQFSSDTGVQAAYYDFAQHIFRSQGGAERMRIDSSGNFGIANTSPGQKLTVGGTIESTSGGFKFPDGSTQTSAASAGITTGKAIAMAIVFG